MNDGKTSTSTVIAGALWAAAGLIMLAAVWSMGLGHWKAALLISQLACMTSAVAAVAHVRIYAVRIAGIIRRLHGLEVIEPTDRSRV